MQNKKIFAQPIILTMFECKQELNFSLIIPSNQIVFSNKLNTKINL